MACHRDYRRTGAALGDLAVVAARAVGQLDCYRDRRGWSTGVVGCDLVVVWWRLPARQVTGLSLKIRDPKARADTEDNFRKTVGQALGGAAVLIGAAAAYLQFSQQQQASRDLLISNQVSKGFEQLGSKEVATRLGGIYGLEGVMNTSSEYHQPVLEALCAFVRDGTIGMIVKEGGTATDVQAALTVIGRRKSGPGIVNLTGANIPGAVMSGAHLSEAQLSGTDLRGATLFGADLTVAFLFHADLRRAVLNDAHLNSAFLLEGADLSGTRLGGPVMSSSADLSGVSLLGAIWHDYVVRVLGVDLRGGGVLRDPEVRLAGADLSDASLIGAHLISADLRGANLRGAYLSKADLSGADLTNAKSLTQTQLNAACGKPAALPPGLTLDKPCPEETPVALPLNRKATP
jgi:uncharacterized protein YjbI with pentapeptide repeats